MSSVGEPLWAADSPQRFLNTVLDAILGEVAFNHTAISCLALSARLLAPREHGYPAPGYQRWKRFDAAQLPGVFPSRVEGTARNRI
jgi:hypothetical protein